MPDHSARPFIKTIEGDKVLVVHTLHGDVNIHNHVLEQRKDTRRKRWRPLADTAYRSAKRDKLDQAFLWLLHVQLHRTFASERYVDFVSLISHPYSEDGEATTAALTSQHEAFVEGCASLFDALKSPSGLQVATDLTAEAAQFRKWRVQTAMDVPVGSAVEAPVAHRFIYDGASRLMVIRPEQTSVIAEEYPNALGTTSEVLAWLSNSTASPIVGINISTAERSYPLFKLVLAMLDHKFTWDDLRVNPNDPEEWDYLYPTAEAALPAASS